MESHPHVRAAGAVRLVMRATREGGSVASVADWRHTREAGKEKLRKDQAVAAEEAAAADISDALAELREKGATTAGRLSAQLRESLEMSTQMVALRCSQFLSPADAQHCRQQLDAMTKAVALYSRKLAQLESEQSRRRDAMITSMVERETRLIALEQEACIASAGMMHQRMQHLARVAGWAVIAASAWRARAVRGRLARAAAAAKAHASETDGQLVEMRRWARRGRATEPMPGFDYAEEEAAEKTLHEKVATCQKQLAESEAARQRSSIELARARAVAEACTQELEEVQATVAEYAKQISEQAHAIGGVAFTPAVVVVVVVAWA